MGFRWKLISAFVAIFLIGGLCGSVLSLARMHNQTQAAQVNPPQKWEDTLMRNLTKRLDLTPEQQSVFRPKIRTAIQQVRTLRRELVAQSDRALDETLQNLETELTPDQQRRMENFREKRKERLREHLNGTKP